MTNIINYFLLVTVGLLASYLLGFAFMLGVMSAVKRISFDMKLKYITQDQEEENEEHD